MTKHFFNAVAASFLLSLGVGSASAEEVDCATAEHDIQRLEHEKLNTAERMAKGVTSIMPIGLVAKSVKGTEDNDVEMATGDYNDHIDRSIAAIKKKCGLD